MNHQPLRPQNQNRLANHLLHLRGHGDKLGDPKKGYSNHFHPHRRSSFLQNYHWFLSLVYLKFYLNIFAFISLTKPKKPTKKKKN